MESVDFETFSRELIKHIRDFREDILSIERSLVDLDTNLNIFGELTGTLVSSEDMKLKIHATAIQKLDSLEPLLMCLEELDEDLSENTTVITNEVERDLQKAITSILGTLRDAQSLHVNKLFVMLTEWLNYLNTLDFTENRSLL